MFGIGGGEIFLIIVVALMLFGSENIPQIARSLGRIMAQVRHATDGIKHEIQKSAEESGLDAKSLTGGITDEIEKARQGFTKMINEHTPNDNLGLDDLTKGVSDEYGKAAQDINDISEGPIKRQR